MLWAILGIFAFFVLALGLRQIAPRICAVCFAVSATWVLGFFADLDPLVLAMLMGGSAVGLMYYLKLEFFKLPYLLSAFALIYFVLRELRLEVLLAVAGVWLAFSLLYVLREGGAKSWFKKVVECCRNW